MSHRARKISIAPMMDWTDRHCRYFLRLISKHSYLYTEMVNAKAIVHGKALHLLNYNPEEHPLALQLGGNEPEVLAAASIEAEKLGYDEINLNVGCPSDRVQSGFFGACLMQKPDLVRDCIAATQAAVSIPVTVKCRIGIDREESYDFLQNFVSTVAQSGCNTFIVHARNAWLKGLSPKENRNIPPLRYDIVYQLKQEFPALEIIINGGIKTYADIDEHLQHVDGVMLGREAYHNPYILAQIDHRYYSTEAPTLSRFDIAERMLAYIDAQREKDISLHHITRHMLGLFHAEPGARQWRRYLTENSTKPGAGRQIVEAALALIHR